MDCLTVGQLQLRDQRFQENQLTRLSQQRSKVQALSKEFQRQGQLLQTYEQQIKKLQQKNCDLQEYKQLYQSVTVDLSRLKFTLERQIKSKNQLQQQLAKFKAQGLQLLLNQANITNQTLKAQCLHLQATLDFTLKNHQLFKADVQQDLAQLQLKGKTDRVAINQLKRTLEMVEQQKGQLQSRSQNRQQVCMNILSEFNNIKQQNSDLKELIAILQQKDQVNQDKLSELANQIDQTKTNNLKKVSELSLQREQLVYEIKSNRNVIREQSLNVQKLQSNLQLQVKQNSTLRNSYQQLLRNHKLVLNNLQFLKEKSDRDDEEKNRLRKEATLSQKTLDHINTCKGQEKRNKALLHSRKYQAQLARRSEIDKMESLLEGLSGRSSMNRFSQL